jgi:hypothetical protein
MSAWTKATMKCRRIAAVGCLIAFSFGPAKLLPVLLAFSSNVEGSHAVHIKRNADGNTKVVLHHSRSTTRRFEVPPAETEPVHRHGIASELVCWFADSETASPDHIARFATGGPVEEGPGKMRLHSCGPTLKFFSGLAAERSLVCSARHISPGVSTLTWTVSTTLQHCIRSTCLLI